MAVWAFGPPTAVQNPSTSAASRAAVSDGVRSLATRIKGSAGNAGRLRGGVDQQAQHALAHIADVDRALGQQRVAQPGQLGGALVDHGLPGRGGALVLADPRMHQIEQVGVGHDLAVNLEDRRLARVGLVQQPLAQGEQLRAGLVERRLEARLLLGHPDGALAHDDLGAAELVDRADRDAGRACDALDEIGMCCRRRGGDGGGGDGGPAVHGARFSVLEM